MTVKTAIDFDALFAAAPADFPERLADNFNALLAGELQNAGRLLDWVGVAAMTPISERVLILCAEYVSRTGQMPLDEALAKGREILDAD
jgi:hypothetical protein